MLSALAGAVTMFGADALPPVIDLDSTGAGVTVFGDDPDDRSGYKVAAGDINGDAVDDLIVGAYWADSVVGPGAGKAYVIYGGLGLPDTIDLNSTSADLTVSGRHQNSWLGSSVDSGDINGDAIDDLIVGAFKASPSSGRSWAGEVYVIYGGPSLPAAIDLSSTNANVRVLGDDLRDEAGSTVAAGDINGDTIDDLIVSAWKADGPETGPLTSCDLTLGDRCTAGEIYVIYGGLGLPAIIDLDSASADLTVYGSDTGDELGYSADAGDINGDGTDDLIIGASRASPAGGSEAGETYVIYGGPDLPASIDLNTTSADLAVLGDDPDDRSGSFAAAGDIDGDGADDLIVGAWPADPGGRSDAGKTYVIYGGTGLPATIDLNSTTADLTVLGDDVHGRSAWNVAAADINSDSTDDLIISASRASPAGRTEAGETYVIYGGPDLPASIDLNTTSADLAVLGDDVGDFSGWSVAAGDINGDGADDLIIGALRADPPGGNDAGETYVIYGEPPTPGPPAVGGMVELGLHGDAPAAPSGSSSSRDYTLPVAGVVAFALAAGGWYARWRWLR